MAYVQAGQAASYLDLAESAASAGEAERATAFLERAYETAVTSADTSTAATALMQLALRARLRADFGASIAYARRIFTLDAAAPSSVAFKGFLALGHHYASMGHDATVVSLMLQAESHLSNATLSDICSYFELRGTAEARLGHIEESVRAFDTLIDLSTRHDAPITRAMRLSTAAANAASLGLMERANALHERAVAIAGSSAVVSISALPAYSYAWTSLMAGDLARAQALLGHAHRLPSKHLHVRLMRASVGTVVGCLIEDRAFAKQYLDLDALDLSLAETNAYRAGPLAGAVHEYYALVGDDAAAARLRERVMQRIATPHGCWWLLLKVAVVGSLADAQRASTILEPYHSFPLARAHKLAVDARIARLSGAANGRTTLARKAASIFRTLGWRYHERTCLSLVGNAPATRGARRGTRRALSGREVDVARLVAQGLSNRQIAKRLGMPERTVKYHLTFIFDRLQVRQRSELADVVNRDPQVLARL